MTVLEIITAEEAGFCFGVHRAIDMAFKAVDEHSNTPVYTLGPIIHNPQVVAKLEKLGISSVQSLDEVDEGIIIIRSHGVEPRILEKARKKGLHIIDATCPFVKNAQKYAQELVKDGYQTIIYGENDHPEVIGIYGATDNKAVIINDLGDLDNIKLHAKVGIIAQTTQSPESFSEIVADITSKVKEVKVYNTICNTTESRQQAAAELAQQVDVMFIIGGHNSGNTKRLAEICSRTGTPSYHIETADEIDWQWLNGKRKIGITAGASTPDWLIREVIKVMTEEKKDIEVQELQEEVNETITDNNIEEEFKYSDNDIADLKKGQTVEGTVIEINDNGVYVDVGYKTEGFIPLRELSHREFDSPSDLVSVDDKIKVVVLTLEDSEGNLILSKKQADYEKAWEKIMETYEDDQIIEAEVIKEVKGGLVVDIGIRGFIPASHVAMGYVENLEEYIGKTLRLKVIEVERDKNNVVLSAKKVIEEETAKLKEETMQSLEEGQEITGKVTKLVDFGAFIDLGGIEGLLHISEMSWGRIEHPSEVLEEGQDVKVKILGINREEERISLGMKQLLPDPWEEFAAKHYEGEVIEGTITKLVDFGAFMEIENGIEGLIHISQLSRKHVKTADEVVKVGETRDAKIINIDPAQKRVGLSLKELEPEVVKKAKPAPKQKVKQQEEVPSGATIGELVGDIFDTNDNDQE